MAIVATLLTLAVPRYFISIDRSKEAVLKENLFQIRDAIGKYHADKGKYPDSLQALATEQYLRKVPIDPVTQSEIDLGGGAGSRDRNRRRIRRAQRRAGQEPPTAASSRHGEATNEGFTYIGVLLATAILTAGLGLAIEAWHTTLRREKEADLLHIGIQYQRAIMLYYEGSPTGQPRYPRELEGPGARRALSHRAPLSAQALSGSDHRRRMGNHESARRRHHGHPQHLDRNAAQGARRRRDVSGLEIRLRAGERRVEKAGGASRLQHRQTLRGLGGARRALMSYSCAADAAAVGAGRSPKAS